MSKNVKDKTLFLNYKNKGLTDYDQRRTLQLKNNFFM